VRVPLVWLGTFAPTAECGECGAVGDSPHGPVIYMRQAPPVRTYTDSMTPEERARLTGG
jgi:hypothetical protein